MRKRKERKRHDSLALFPGNKLYGTLLKGNLWRHSSFYTLKAIYVIKWAVTGWRGFCRLTMTNTFLPAVRDQ
jgi:hypothetical protein